MKTSSIWILLAALLVFALSSCSLSVSPDGAKSFSIDAAQATKAIELFNQK
jgi:hypothetical protein